MKMKYKNNANVARDIHVKQSVGDVKAVGSIVNVGANVAGNVGSVGSIVNVKAGESGEKDFGVIASMGSIVNVDVSAGQKGEKLIKHEQIRNDCPVGTSAEMKVVCDTAAGNGVLITFNNKSKDVQKLVVTSDGKTVGGSPFDLKSNAVETRKFLKVEAGGAKIKVTNGKDFAVEKDIKIDCKKAEKPTAVKVSSDDKVSTDDKAPKTEVRSEVVEKKTSSAAPELAMTGLEASKALLIGSLLVGLGLVALQLRNRRKYEM